MSCNSQIHDELKNMEEYTCPFCGKQLAEVDSSMRVVTSCCDKQNVIKDNKANICMSCGALHC